MKAEAEVLVRHLQTGLMMAGSHRAEPQGGVSWLKCPSS
jgi:hypothetical protein